MLSNAIKFTPFGGIITITGKKVTCEDELTLQNEALVEVVRANPNKVYLEMQVKDTGIGIRDKDLPKLF